MKPAEIRELSDEQLAKKLEDGRAELFNLRFQMATSQLDNTARVTNGKMITMSKKLHAHDEEQVAKVGDTVKVMETRPLSKTKRWRLVEVVEEAK